MPYRNGNKVWNETEWTPRMIRYLTNNYKKLTNQKLADGLNLRLTTVRTKLYELGFKRMEMEYWTKAQISFLRKNYKKMGDTEIADYFCVKYYKEKGWSKKHVEKKRRYLKLKRTDEEKKKIHARNVRLGFFTGCPVKAWITRGGPAAEKTIRWWKTSFGYEFPVIKIGDKWIHWNRYAWIKHYGPIKPGLNVVFINGCTRDIRMENLELMSDGELAKNNAGHLHLSDNYISALIAKGDKNVQTEVLNNPDLLELKRNQLLLNREILKQDE